MSYPSKSRKKMAYHGRECNPIIHQTESSKRKYIMVRTEDGGTKRLYLDKNGDVPKKHRKGKMRGDGKK